MEKDYNNQFDFSVIVCCYNSNIEKLKKTLLSIYKQENVSFEVIISDDGSTIDFKENIESWLIENNYKNWKLNFLRNNVGTVKNIISAVKISNGKYIKTISPGDYFAKVDALKKFKDAAILNEADLVFSDTVFYNENSIVKLDNISHKKIIYSKKSKKSICFYGGYFMGAAFIAKKSLYEQVLYDFENVVIYMEDRALIYVSYILNKKIVGIKEQLIWYEYGTGISTKTTHNEKLDKDEANTYLYLESKFCSNKIARKMVKLYKVSKMSKFKRFFYYVICCPEFFIYKLRNKISSRIKLTLNMADFNEITSI